MARPKRPAAAPAIQPAANPIPDNRPAVLFTRFLRMIRFSHTVFALPFALAATLVVAARYREQVSVTAWKVLLIVLAFTGMRSFAMAVNRLADRHIDARNARTAGREIPAGLLSVRAVQFFAVLSLLTTIVTAYLLSPVAGYLALPAAIIVAGYSLAKRFTWLCHFWLGAAIGLAPPAVYVALLQQITPEALLMQAVLMFYIGGFDILYAMQDIEFDRREKLHSIPARFGAAAAMWIARISHSCAAIAAAYLIWYLNFNPLVWCCYAILVGLFVAEHWLVGSVKNPRWEKIPVAFFNVNSAFSLVFLATVAAGAFLP